MCPSPSLPVPLKPDFTITPLAGFSAHSAPPSRETWVSSPLTQVIAMSSLFDFQNMSPDNLHHDHLSRPHAHPPGSLQQPPCLPGRGLHPGASKPSGPALVTPHISLCVQPGGPPPVPGPLHLLCPSVQFSSRHLGLSSCHLLHVAFPGQFFKGNALFFGFLILKNVLPGTCHIA